MNRNVAARVALMAASSFVAVAISSPALANGDSETDRLSATEALRDIVETSTASLESGVISRMGFDADGINHIVANHKVIPGTGSAATGANYANSSQVLDAVGRNGVGQQIAFSQTSPTGGSLGLCTGTLINPRTVITAAHCVYGRPAHEYGSNTGTAGGVNGNFGAITSLVQNPTTGAWTLTRAPVQTKGAPISFGFNSTNRCLETVAGVNGTTTTGAVNGCMAETGAYEIWRNKGFQTDVAAGIYNGNQVWYLTQSQPVTSGGGGEFAHGDIALVTLDTHVRDIPTWTLLFSPLTGPTHATITGYGGAGVGLSGIGSLAGIDYRRRSAENMIDALMSWHDQNTSGAISGPTSTARVAHQHPIYWLDFDDPEWTAEKAASNPNFFKNTAPTGSRNNGYYDFNGLGGTALPNEGATAGGDSGGPLVVDQKWAKKVIAGVLTGSISYNGGLSTYGQFNVYPPLFQFWQDIVANNPYVYASAKTGDGNWHDASHWVQNMDPNYAIIAANGDLVTGVPDTTQGGGDDPSYKFGTVSYLGQECFDADGSGPGTVMNCGTVTGTGPRTGNGTFAYTPGGPGSTNFVPDNIEPVNSANSALHVKARYFDVTLRELGKTTLSASATIDKLTVEGSSSLQIDTGGSLKVWAEFNQLGGWTNVDGTLKAAESLLVSGILSGHGTIDPTYLTVVAGRVAPGLVSGGSLLLGPLTNDSLLAGSSLLSSKGPIGTLTVQGDMIMASASGLLIDLTRDKSDMLKVVADGTNAGVLALNGGAVLFGQAPGFGVRHGQQFTFATADGGVQGKFGSIRSGFGLLQPSLTYGPNSVAVTLTAGSLASYVGLASPTATAIASALDSARTSSYDSLSNLYGNVDTMAPTQAAAALEGLSPAKMARETMLLQYRQSRQLLGNVTDRLGQLGTGQARGVSFSGGASALAQGRDRLSAGAQLGLTSGAPQEVALPNGLTGFVAMGGDTAQASYGDSDRAGAGQRSRYVASGLEVPVGDGVVGSAFGFTEATSLAGTDDASSKVVQASLYGTVSVGKSGYVGAVVAAERARSDSSRLGYDTMSLFRLTGETNSSRYMAAAEAGMRFGLGGGLSLNPRAQLGYSRYALDGYREHGGETALAMDDLNITQLESRLGAKLGGKTMFGAWTLRPQLQADYVRLLSNSANALKLSFAAAPEHGFALPLGGTGSGWMEVKGGVDVSRGAFSLGLSGQATAGDAPIRDQRAAADFTFRF
jgi:V8-like Glu-specific endopeptidase